MPINTGNFGKALWPGINKWYGDAYAEHATEYTSLFDTFSSRKAFEEDVFRCPEINKLVGLRLIWPYKP